MYKDRYILILYLTIFCRNLEDYLISEFKIKMNKQLKKVKIIRMTKIKDQKY